MSLQFQYRIWIDLLNFIFMRINWKRGKRQIVNAEHIKKIHSSFRINLVERIVRLIWFMAGDAFGKSIFALVKITQKMMKMYNSSSIFCYFIANFCVASTFIRAVIWFQFGSKCWCCQVFFICFTNVRFGSIFR